MDDGRLLRQYVKRGPERESQQKSQAAFSALVARHLDFVYSVCRREVGDAALAEDVTQVVFLLLARKAPALRPGDSLTGWLFQTARFAARNARRRESVRQTREQEAGLEMLHQTGQADDALWDRISPALNDALASLGAKDREAVLLRFAHSLSFPELGAALGTSEDAARMRLNRAVDRLRRSLTKGGVVVSGAALAVLLADRAVQSTPAACAAAAASLAGSVGTGASSAATVSPNVHSQLQGALKAMTMTKLKLAAIAGVSALLAGTLPFVTRAQNQPGDSPSATVTRPIIGAAPVVSPADTAGFVMPGTPTGNRAATTRIQIQTFTLDRPYDEVCQFYSRAFLVGDSKTLADLGAKVQGDDTHSVYALHRQPGNQTGVFCRRTPRYTVSSFVTRGKGEDKTEVTLVYEPA